MGNVMAYSGITTKVRAMSAKLLKEKDYDTIAGLGTVTEARRRMHHMWSGWMFPYITGEMWRRSCISRCSMIIRGSSGLPGWSRRRS